MRPSYLILALVALATVLGIVMSGDPGFSERRSEMWRNVAFSGEARQTVLLLAAIGIGGFIAYLTMTRR
jgi:hypothetical protein